MKTIGRCLLLVLLVVHCLPGATLVPGQDPAAACQTFFQALQDRNYLTAWHQLSEKSQSTFCTMVAQDRSTHLSVAQVRRMFDTNAQPLVDGFWTSFRHKLRADIRIFTYAAGPVHGDQGTVNISEQGVSVPIVMKMFYQGGQWRVGFAESLLNH